MSYSDEGSVPAEHAGAEQVADEQFVHGLLETARLDDAQTQQQRMARVVAGIGGDASHLSSARSATNRRVGILDRPGLRRAVGFLTVAAAIVVVAIIIATTDRRSPAEVVAALSRLRAADQQWIYSALADGGEKVVGKWSAGDKGERLLALTVFDGSAGKKPEGGCLILRTVDHSVIARPDKEQPGELRGWPLWLRSGRLAAPLRSPHEWLVTAAKTHAFAFDGSQHIVGMRREGVADSLVPYRLDVWLSEAGAVLRLELGWTPTAIERPKDERARIKSGTALKWFLGLDSNRDGSVDRTEAGAGWSRLSALGFEEVQSVSKREFAAAVGAYSGRQATELLFDRPDTKRSQPPRQLMFKAAPIGNRAPWLFESEVFRRR